MWTRAKVVNTIFSPAAALSGTSERNVYAISSGPHFVVPEISALLQAHEVEGQTASHPVPNGSLADQERLSLTEDYTLWCWGIPSAQFEMRTEPARVEFKGEEDRPVGCRYLEGLAGLSLWINIHAVAARIAPPPIPIAHGESRKPPVAAGAGPTGSFLFFPLLSFCDCESSCVCD